LNAMGVALDQSANEHIDETISLVQNLRNNGFAIDGIRFAPPAAFGFPADKNSLEWVEERVSDPRDLFGRLSESNILLMSSAIPAVIQGTPLFEELEDRGWLLITDDGDAHVEEGNPVSGNQPFGLLDLTNKDVYRLWTERIRQFV